jgi:hypothetical protein
MKTTILNLLFIFGITLACKAQSDEAKPKADSAESVSELRGTPTAQPEQSVTKGITQHGPNDINPVRTDRRPVTATQVRMKPSVGGKLENSDVDTAQPE